MHPRDTLLLPLRLPGELTGSGCGSLPYGPDVVSESIHPWRVLSFNTLPVGPRFSSPASTPAQGDSAAAARRRRKATA